ncbi:LysR family transcriptional regulator [Nocardia aurantia]|uniref:HTH-type transcriptional regulator GltC n=1 Tax=Nocardia aurantia TaxID=2585199 RepID=A0A7K0DZY4_9NOCA|nr:LysR family transcriptional regulator [Nocardia aurantia]MQY31390.1 HTH-type transcriptional regulator GltC [Nocardia aurantia]
MELRQLIYFDTVVREGGFTRAAQRLHVAQPAISAQIKLLETELGVILLDRSTRPPALTHAGELFRLRVRRILDDVDAARTEMSEISAVVRGALRIGATPVLGPIDLVAVIASFRRRHPGVTLSCRSGLLDPLVASLDDGALDVVIGPEHPGLAENHHIEHLADERFVLALPPHHLLTACARVDLAQARDELFVCLPPGSGMHTLLRETAANSGFEPRIDFVADTPATVRAFVAAGLGIAVMAASTTTGPGPTVTTRDLSDPPRHPAITLITPKHPLTPIIRAFADHLSTPPQSQAPTTRPAKPGAGAPRRA